MIKKLFFGGALFLTALNTPNLRVQSESVFPVEVTQFIKEQPSLPRYVEAGYSPLGRSPVVDAVLADPFYLPVYAEETFQELKKQKTLYGISTASFKAGGIPLTEMKLAFEDHSETIPKRFTEAFGNEMGKDLYYLWLAFLQVHNETKELLSVFTNEEKQWILDNRELFFFGSKDSLEYQFLTSDSPVPFQFFRLASRLDLAKLADNALKMALIVDRIHSIKHSLSSIHLTEDFVWEQQGLKFLISAKTESIFTEEADFILALKGRNTFYNNAGGTQGVNPAALHISLEGDNTFIGDYFVQGTGVLGVGVLACFDGHNTFKSKGYSQGAAFFGSSLLIQHKS